MDAMLEECGICIDQPAKRQRIEEVISELIAKSAEKAAQAAAEKCTAMWQSKLGEMVPNAIEEETKASVGAASQDKDATPKIGNSADEACMEAAAASALVGVRLEHGGPFGAAIVRDGVIISCAHNMVLSNKDPTCHAEMTAIRWACKALGTHDLSDCHIYTTCEPCPMCWGAVQWSRLGKAYIGVDRHTAAKYGFDDKVFYDEIDGKSGVYGWKRYGFRVDNSSLSQIPGMVSENRVEKNMVEIYDGICRAECEALFTNPSVNRTYRRRYVQEGTDVLHRAVKDAFPCTGVQRCASLESDAKASQEEHEAFMRRAIHAAEQSAKNGTSKEREPFGTVIVKDKRVIATSCNSVCSSRDATATAEVNAIVEATRNLDSYNLEGCEMYTTVQPDVMSLGAILWSRISRVYCGVTQKFAAQYGFEEATLHFKDLLEVASGQKLIAVEEGIAKEKCEAVFKEWSELNGVIY
jgi:guanine deaminase